MKYFKLISFLLVLLGIAQAANAQSPDWTLNTSDYQYSMTVTAFLNVEGRSLTSEQDMVGAFVNAETRGLAQLLYVESADRYLAYLTIYANKEQEKVEFKIYDSTKDAIISVEKTLNFTIDGQHGNVFQAFSLASPALNGEAEILKFYFTDTDTVSTSISGGYVDIMVYYNADLADITPEFILSEGAKMYIDRELQLSGSQAMDFSEPLMFSVLSEDESVLNNYQLTTTKQQLSGTGFSATNVITANKDGSNDYWVVQDVFQYQNDTFLIFDANGRVLYESTGYRNDWDGYYKGKRLDRGKYYFKIENKENNTSITGNILVLY